MANTKRTRAAGQRYRIQDRAGFAAVLEEAVSRQYGGSRHAAAVAMNIANSTLKRFMDKAASGIARETLEALQQLVGKDRAAQLEATVISPLAKAQIREYDAAVADETLVLTIGPSYALRYFRLSPQQQEWETETGRPLDRLSAAHNLIASLKRRFPAEWVPLNKKLQRRGHVQARGDLAHLRVVAPLLEANQPGGVERSVGDMSPTELRRFISAGVSREVLLLDRKVDVRRAQDDAAKFERLYFGTDAERKKYAKRLQNRRGATQKEKTRPIGRVNSGAKTSYIPVFTAYRDDRI